MVLVTRLALGEQGGGKESEIALWISRHLSEKEADGDREKRGLRGGGGRGADSRSPCNPEHQRCELGLGGHHLNQENSDE